MGEAVELPILFSGPMVREILAGRKTHTRRPLRVYSLGMPVVGAAPKRIVVYRQDPGHSYREPRWKPGMHLWVRETWANVALPGYEPVIFYRADDDRRPGYATPPGTRWKPSIHMLRKHSRIMLEVDDVRVERLKAITEDQAVAEGCTETLAGFIVPGQFWPDGVTPRTQPRAIMAFACLWRAIHGPLAWDANPMVAAIIFRRIET